MRLRTALIFSLALASSSRPAFAAPPAPAITQALEGFTAWDADKNDRLSLAELDRAIASPEVKGERAAAAVALRRLARSKTHPITEFTRESLLATAPTLRFADSRDDEETPEPETTDKTRGNLDRYYDSALRKIAAASSSSRALFVGAPNLENFHQGRLGTCFCLAPLTALTAANPAELSKRFSPSADGSAVTVTFGLGHAVTVTALTDGEIALGADTGGNGLWAATYEKAVGELRRSSANAADTPYAIATRGGSAGTMLSALTGRSIQRFSCKAWLPSAKTPAPELEKKLGELRTLLRDASAHGRLMTAGTSLKTRKVPSLSQNHAYAVFGYDAATDLVTIRDPHGQDFTPKGTPGLENGYAVRRGVFQIPATEVVFLMAGFAFQLETPAKTKGYPSADAAEPAATL